MRSNDLKEFLKKIRGKKHAHKEFYFRESYALLSVIFNQASHLMGLLKPDGTVIKINPTAYGFIKGKESEVLGRPFWETPWWAHSPEQQELLREAIKASAQGKSVSFEATHITSEGEIVCIDFSLKPVMNEKGSVVLLVPEGHDITERKRAEEALREAAIKYRIVADNTYNWEFWVSPEGRFIYTSPSCQRISGHGAEEFNAEPALIWSIIHPDDRQLWADHRHDIIQIKTQGELVLRLVRPDGEIRWIHHICLPVFDDNGNFLGTRGSFSDITEQKKAAAALLDNARIKRELEIAKEIQQALLPVCPRELPGMLTACRCVPATHVGGDYYDFFLLEAGIVDVVIADVAGHSVGSALLMAMTRSVIHAKVAFNRLPGMLLAAVNDLLYDDLSRSELQISMFYARLDTESSTLAYANAGHNPPFLFRCRQGVFMELDADGLLMGIKTDVCFEEKKTGVEAGDILILYTDGVTEAENSVGELFGIGRLRRVISEHCARHPEEIIAAIFQELTAFTGSKPLLDDVAMTIFKIV